MDTGALLTIAYIDDAVEPHHGLTVIEPHSLFT